MRKAEQKLWDTMRNNKPRGVVLNRVENYVGEGMPDVYLRVRSLATWVELKAPIAPKRETTRLMGDQGMRQEQINWHLQSAALNLPTWILIRDTTQRRLWVVEGRFADEVNDMTVETLDLEGIRCHTWGQAFDEMIR